MSEYAVSCWPAVVDLTRSRGLALWRPCSVAGRTWVTWWSATDVPQLSGRVTVEHRGQVFGTAGGGGSPGGPWTWDIDGEGSLTPGEPLIWRLDERVLATVDLGEAPRKAALTVSGAGPAAEPRLPPGSNPWRTALQHLGRYAETPSPPPAVQALAASAELHGLLTILSIERWQHHWTLSYHWTSDELWPLYPMCSPIDSYAEASVAGRVFYGGPGGFSIVGSHCRARLRFAGTLDGPVEELRLRWRPATDDDVGLTAHVIA